MQDPRSTSTLELVVNEQQLQNMSQIDLSRPDEQNNQNDQQQMGQDTQTTTGERFSFQQLKKWPTRFRESFNAKMDEAKSKSDTKTQFVFEVMHAFSGIVIWILCFICTTIVPVILFFIGLANLDDCSDRPPLPYLIFATGFVMTASNLFNLALALDLPILANHSMLSSDIKNTIASILNIIFNCVVAFLYILSAYMVFTIGNRKRHLHGDNETGPRGSSPPNGDDSEELEEASLDCSSLLYYFTFWFITLTLGLFVILCLVAIICFAYNKYRLAIIRGSTPRSQNQTNTTTTNPKDVYVSNRV